MSVIVPPIGPLDADICLVGEAPGEVEERKGEPFVGPAGQLLDKLLKAAGILRRQCYITNVIKVRPPNNKISEYLNLKGKYPVETDLYKEHRDNLKKELEKVKSNIIVTLGQPALYALTGHYNKITVRRGSMYDSTLLPGRKVLATAHPSYVLRGNYFFRHFIVFDLLKAKEQAAFPELKLPQRDLIVSPSFEQCTSFLDMILEDKPLTAFDIEVYNEEVSCISFAPSSKVSICIPFIYRGKEYFTIDKEAYIWSLIAKILESNSIKKLAQNGIFDSSFLYRRYGIRTRNFDDTMIGQNIVTPDFPKGLDFICSVYTDEPYYKDEGKKWFSFGESELAFWEYNAKDSAVLHDAWPKIEKNIKRFGNDQTYERQNKLNEILLFMQEKGIRMDVEGIKEQFKRNETELGELEERLNKLCGYEINHNSPKQLAQYFYIQKGIKPYMKKGSITTDETAMIRLARRDYEEAQIILRLRRLTKMNSNYYNISKISSDNRLRCSFNPARTKTGRLSSSEDIFGEGTNLQNQPHEVKQFMLADPDHLAFSIDLSQAENRIVAHIAPEPTMIQAFEEGDVHSLTAAMIMKRYYHGKIPAGITVRSISPLGTGDQPWRFWGKKANHGLNYGQGYKKFAIQNQLTEPDSKQIVSGYFELYPGIRAYHRWVEDDLNRNDRILMNMMGRVRKFFGAWGPDLFNEAYNFIPQSTVGDIINERGLIFIYYDQHHFKDVILLNQIHDSIEFEIPVLAGFEYMARSIKAIVKSLETPISWRGRELIIPAETCCGHNLLEHSKENPLGMRELDTKQPLKQLASNIEKIYRGIEDAKQKAT